MKALRRTLAIAPYLVAATLSAQNDIHLDASNPDAQPRRSFAVVDSGSVTTFIEDWAGSSALMRYVQDHKDGNYVVFAANGVLHRLDSPAQLAEIQTLYSPMRALAEKQRALSKAQQPLAHQQHAMAEAQRPLAEQQRSLGEQQRAASTTTNHLQLAEAQGGIGQQQAELGRVQGAIGQQQAELGRVQGAIGRQQGELARAASGHMQVLFTQCLKDGSCPRIAL